MKGRPSHDVHGTIGAWLQRTVCTDSLSRRINSDLSMHESAASDEISETEAAERVTKNMVAIGRKRSRGRRHLKTIITIVALVIAAVIFGSIYMQTLQPGFEWK